MEADDAVCIEQTFLINQGIETCIAGIDKDLMQQAGWHYRWPVGNREGLMYFVSPSEGLINLYTQALVGDKVDNIMYYLDVDGSNTWKKNYGLGAVGASNLLTGMVNEVDMYSLVLDTYLSSPKFIRKDTGLQCTEQDLVMNMRLLYMLRHTDDNWNIPK
jgi:hypothetical protein